MASFATLAKGKEAHDHSVARFIHDRGVATQAVSGYDRPFHSPLSNRGPTSLPRDSACPKRPAPRRNPPFPSCRERLVPISPLVPPPLSFYQRLDDHPFIKQDPRNGALESGCPRQARDYQSGMRQTVRHSTLDHDQYSSNHPPRPVFSSLCTMPYILRTSKCRARKLSRSGNFLPSMMSSSAG